MRKDLKFGSFELAVFDFSTDMSQNGSTIPALSAQLIYEIKRHYRGRDVLIIAHSLGGVVARNMLLQGALWSPGNRIRGLITFGSPFGGVKLAAVATEGGFPTSLVQDLSGTSTLLSNMKLTWLQAKTRRAEIGFVHFCIGSDGDSVVDMNSALLDCDVPRPVTRWGHIELIKPIDMSDHRYILVVEGIDAISRFSWGKNVDREFQGK